MQSALDQLAPIATGLLEPTQGMDLLEAQGVYPRIDPGMFERWSEELNRIAEKADLKLQLQPLKPDAIGGRRAQHSDAFAGLLDELTEVYRLEPEAAW